jgi:hypothetical protein
MSLSRWFFDLILCLEISEEKNFVVRRNWAISSELYFSKMPSVTISGEDSASSE